MSMQAESISNKYMCLMDRNDQMLMTTLFRSSMLIKYKIPLKVLIARKWLDEKGMLSPISLSQNLYISKNIHIPSKYLHISNKVKGE